jgi:hypothetical protein
VHFYSVWTTKTNLLPEYIYKIICSLFHINRRKISFGCNKQFNVEILILINSRWHQNLQRWDFDRDQIKAASKILTLGLVVLSLEFGIKIFYVSILMMIKSRPHQKF